MDYWTGQPSKRKVKGYSLGTLVSGATAIGLRLGEALGLDWVGVNFDAPSLCARRSSAVAAIAPPVDR